LKVELLQKESNDQKATIQELEEKNRKANSELERQSAYSAAMGSVIGTMLWKTSKTQEAIETYIETDTLGEFLNLACVVLRAFKETYVEEIPFAESHEHKYILSIFGIFVNIVAQRVGRNFILERDAGVNFINHAISYLKDIPMPSGQVLKRLILMMLFNVSITNRGALLIETSENCIENVLKCTDQNNTSEIQSLALSIMTSLLEELPTQNFVQKVIQVVRKIRNLIKYQFFIFIKIHQVSQDDLQKILNSDTESVRFVCLKFINKIKSLNDADNSFEY
jgi:hypothetical protein